MGYSVISSARKSSPENPNEIQSVSPNTALKELFDLLENYSPTWYTEEHHNRAAAALLRSAEYHFRPAEASRKTIPLRSHGSRSRKRN
jgi:hypothetical protein